MTLINVPVPCLMTAHQGPLHPMEQTILAHVAEIESWFRKRWQETPPSITCSVDLRHAGFKLAPVDTNLFPAGFNNLNDASLPLCIQAVQSVLGSRFPHCTKILLLPESHTRNVFYLQSLCVLRDILVKAGFVVRVGSLDEDVTEPIQWESDIGGSLLLEPLQRVGRRLRLADYDPCLVLLNNDLSTGIPDKLRDLEQPVWPDMNLGWSSRLKSSHFDYFNGVADEFSALLGMDSWRMNSLFSAVDGIDFMAQTGMDALASEVDRVLALIAEKYAINGIDETPFVAVKADNGTYGMSVMMVRSGGELLALNRKQRTKMSASKGSRKVTRVLIQEGVPSYETMPNGAVAEPVVYMMGPFVVGGFYRVHHGRGKDDNLNAPGMHFEPLAFAKPCNVPCEDKATDVPNRFYVYGVIARLAALAAAREMAATKGA